MSPNPKTQMHGANLPISQKLSNLEATQDPRGTLRCHHGFPRGVLRRLAVDPHVARTGKSTQLQNLG